MPNHAIMHVQFSSGITIWHFKCSRYHCKQMICLKQGENRFCLILKFLLTIRGLMNI